MLSWDQVQRLDSILGESVPIHGRGNFPTLSVQPRQIVQVRAPRLSLLLCMSRQLMTAGMELGNKKLYSNHIMIEIILVLLLLLHFSLRVFIWKGSQNLSKSN